MDYIAMWIVWPISKLYATTFKFKTCLNLWVYSLFTLWSISSVKPHCCSSFSPSSKNHTAPPISSATFFLAQPWWCQKQVNPLLPASALSWQLQCPHYPAMDTTILGCWCFQHLRTAVSLFSWSVVSLLLLCVLHIHFCDLNQSKHSHFEFL